MIIDLTDKEPTIAERCRKFAEWLESGNMPGHEGIVVVVKSKVDGGPNQIDVFSWGSLDSVEKCHYALTLGAASLA